MKKIKLYLMILAIIFSDRNGFAQKDIIYKNDSIQIRCKILKIDSDKYEYAFADQNNRVLKNEILKTFVDSVRYNYYESNLVDHKIFDRKTTPETREIIPVQRNWQFQSSIGLDIGNIMEWNSPDGNDKKSLSGSLSIDANASYSKEGTRFATTNELHYLFGLQKSGLNSAAHIQRTTDNLNTLHDVSLAIGKTKKLNANVIVRATTSVFTIYKGDYFQDVDSQGKSQAFLSPYDVTVSPGIKWQPDKYLRVSISPYSFNLYGVKDRQVSNTGVFISEMDVEGQYKRMLFKRLGAEVNLWYDWQIKQWLDIQYRAGISSNYFEKIAKNGLADGLFITRIKLIKDFYLTHRFTLKGDLSSRPFKPYCNQNILLSYAKSF